MPSIIYDPQKAESGKYKNSRYIHGVKLLTGNNNVPASSYSKIKKDPAFVRLREEGVIVDVLADEFEAKNAKAATNSRTSGSIKSKAKVEA